jgi:hypothetical protein
MMPLTSRIVQPIRLVANRQPEDQQHHPA